MKLIPLSITGKYKGKYFVQVDDSDFDWLNQWKWYVQKGRKSLYAARNINNKSGGQSRIMMHNVIAPNIDGLLNDHVDNNGLNNQRYNLRKATSSQNAMNRPPQREKKYKGVCYILQKKKRAYGEWQKPTWRALIKINGKAIRIGSFDTEIDAALAYNKKAKELHGEFAYLNKVYCNPCIVNNNLVQQFNQI